MLCLVLSPFIILVAIGHWLFVSNGIISKQQRSFKLGEQRMIMKNNL